MMKSQLFLIIALLFYNFSICQDPILFEEGSISVSLGSNVKSPSTNKHVTFNFRGKENPQFYIAFEDLQWKKNNSNKVYHLLIDSDWITIKGDNHTIKKSKKEIKLYGDKKRKIYFNAIDNGKVLLEIQLQVIKSRGKDRKSVYSIEKVINIRGIDNSLAKEETVETETIMEKVEEEPSILDDYSGIDEEELENEIATSQPSNYKLDKANINNPINNSHPKPSNLQSVSKNEKRTENYKPEAKNIEVTVSKEIKVVQNNPIDSSKVEEKFSVDIEDDQGDIEIKIHSGKPPYFVVIEDHRGNIRYKEKMNANCPCIKTIFPEILLLSAGKYQIKVTDAKKNLSFEKDLIINYLTSFNAQASMLKSHLAFMICSLLVLVFIIVFLLVNSKSMVPMTRILSYYYKFKSFLGIKKLNENEKEPNIRILNIPDENEGYNSIKPNKH